MATFAATVLNILRANIEMLDSGAAARIEVAVCRRGDGSLFSLQIDGEAPDAGASILVDTTATKPGRIDHHIGTWRLAA